MGNADSAKPPKTWVSAAERAVKVEFKDKDLLARALTHRSFSAEVGAVETNEKLEFLGDSVLNLTVTEFIYHKYPHLKEGDLAKLRASLVNAETLAEVAKDIGLGKYIVMGKGAETTGGRRQVSILGDAYEAVIGALYLDQGMEAARQFVLDRMRPKIAERVTEGEFGDAKTRLQEYVIAKYGETPRYETVETHGPVHDRTFTVQVTVRKRSLGRGIGKSKKQAEQQAAAEALKKLMA